MVMLIKDILLAIFSCCFGFVIAGLLNANNEYKNKHNRDTYFKKAGNEIFNAKSNEANVIKENPNPNFVPPASKKITYEDLCKNIGKVIDMSCELGITREDLEKFNKCLINSMCKVD